MPRRSHKALCKTVAALKAAIEDMNAIINEPGTPPKSVLRAWQERHGFAPPREETGRE